MILPDLSNSMYVAQMRYIQSIHEPPKRQNPDKLVRHFLSLRQRLRSSWIRQAALSKLRQDPFYYYLIARTRYYDQVLQDAVREGIKRLVIVGAGSDTRAYRFQDLLRQHGIKVLECDQPSAIQVKQQLARRWHRPEYIDYLPIDLNDGVWTEFERRISSPSLRTLVLIEGVSPYINHEAFAAFLRVLGTRTAPGSLVAYDFKLAGIRDAFGCEGKTNSPFRLPAVAAQVEPFHQPFGLRLEHMELSSELCARLIPDLDVLATPLFDEDALIRTRVAGGSQAISRNAIN